MLELMKRIAENTNRILPVVDININRDSSIIYSQYIEGKKQNSLAEKETELTKEWHPTKKRKFGGLESANMSGRLVLIIGDTEMVVPFVPVFRF